MSLRRLAAFAEKRGQRFDLQAAINSGMPVDDARNQLINAMAEADEALPTHSFSTSPSAARDSARDGWDRAMAKAAALRGIKV